MYIMSWWTYCVCITRRSQDQNSRWIQTEAPYAQELLYTLRLLSQTHTRHSNFSTVEVKQPGERKKKTTHSFKVQSNVVICWNFKKMVALFEPFMVLSGKRREDRATERRRKLLDSAAPASNSCFFPSSAAFQCLVVDLAHFSSYLWLNG